MKFKVITLFPEIVNSLENYSIVGRAVRNKKIKLDLINLRDFGIGKHKQVDDKPFGGGAGMLLRIDVLSKAIKSAKKPRVKSRKVILLSPEGEKFTQKKAEKYSHLKELVLVCGHYEGFDERIKNYVDEVISVGDYVLTGGEIPAMTIVDSVSRLIPGVINPKSLESESFSPAFEFENEFPQYTRPEEFEGRKAPNILLSGDHKKISVWQTDNRKSRP